MISAASGVSRQSLVAQNLNDIDTTPIRSGVDNSRGYPVGDGSFANQVRGTAPQPELDLQFAMMANDAYALNTDGPTGTQSEKELAAAGWQRLRPEGDHLVDAQGNQIPIDPQLLRNEDSGFDAAIYQNDKGQYVVAYRGTDNWFNHSEGGLDTPANLGQGAGFETQQYRDAIALAMRAEEAFGPGNVAITGHSLGGGLASAAMLAIDAPGVTFNAAGLSDNTLRSLNLGGQSPNALREELAHSGQIRRYNVEGELLTNLQQGMPLPDAVGHELRVAAPEGMGWSPVERHGGGGDGASYVESLRQNNAYRPSQLPPGLRMIEQTGEYRLNVLASSLGNLYDVGNNTVQVVSQKYAEVGQTLRTDFAQGHVLAGVARVTGQLNDGVLDVGAGVVREAGDLAGDIARENTTLVGNFLRNLGRQVPPLATAMNATASAVESMGEKANWALDQLGKGGAWLLDKAGDGLAWTSGKFADGMVWAGNTVINAAIWTADRVVDGATWAADRVVDGATWIADKAADGARWVGDKVMDGARWANENLNPLNWFGTR